MDSADARPILGLSVAPVLAAAQGPKPRLPAPTGVTCPVVDGSVVITTTDVEGAAGFQSQLACVDAEGESLADVSVFTEELTAAIPLSALSDALAVQGFTLEACAAVEAKVRALPGPKHAGGPLQGGGPKGLWSATCAVVLP
jgi:hypothetical protein